MEDGQLDMFGNIYGRKCKFMVIISPPDNIVANIGTVKKQLYDSFGYFDAFNSPAHISFFEFKQFENQIDPMIASFKNSLMGFKEFTISLVNYDFFEKSKTVYVDIEDKQPIIEIFYSLVKKRTGFIPHLTIAKNLDNNSFPEVMQMFAAKEFRTAFICNKVTVIKKAGGEKRWQHFIDLPLS